MTIIIVAAIGLLGTLLFGYVAYRHWSTLVPKRTKPIKPTQTGTTIPTPVAGRVVKSKWLLWPIAIVLLVVAYNWQQEAKKAVAAAERQRLIDTAATTGDYPCPYNFVYVVTREWGKTVTRPAGCHFVVERRMASVGYEMAATTTTGDVTVTFPVGQPTDIRKVVPNALSFRLRIMAEETENEVSVMVSLYRW